MNRFTSLIAAAGLALAFSAHADEDKIEVQKDPNHIVIEKKHKRGGHTDKTKVESKSRHRMGGGTVSTTETTVEHDHPGIGNDTTTKATETVEKDAKGNVVRHEKKVTH